MHICDWPAIFPVSLFVGIVGTSRAVQEDGDTTANMEVIRTAADSDCRVISSGHSYRSYVLSVSLSDNQKSTIP